MHENLNAILKLKRHQEFNFDKQIYSDNCIATIMLVITICN